MKIVTSVRGDPRKLGLGYLASAIDGVMVIPIKNAEPILIFKVFGETFYEECFIEEIGRTFIFNDYAIFWKGKNYRHDLPSVIFKHYGKNIDLQLMPHKTFDEIEIDGDCKPSGVFEVPLSLIMDKQKYNVQGVPFIVEIRKTLRGLGALKERRGTGKTLDAVTKKRRMFVRGLCKKTQKSKKPILITKILDLWSKEVQKNKLDEKYYASEATICRDLKLFIKK